MPPEPKPDATAERVYMRPAEGEPDDAFADRFADAVVEGVNRWRKDNGLPPLVKDDPADTPPK